MQDDPRVDRRLVDRLLEVQPSRPDVTQAQRRMQLERAVDWITAVSITVSRVGYRFEWRLSPMPVRWRADDRGVAFELNDYVSQHGWVPLGQLYGVPPPTDEPLRDAMGVYPPYHVDTAYIRWFASTVRTWRRFRDAQGRLAQRRAQYAARREAARRALAGECVGLCWVQENWELRDVAASCLGWVDRNNPPTAPVNLTRRERLPEHLHPCGVWGDLLESPTEREEMGPYAAWPPPDLAALGRPEDVGLVVPAVRTPAEREESAVPPRRPRPTPRAEGRSRVETRSKRARVEETPAVTPSEGGAESSAQVPAAVVAADPSRPQAESPAEGEGRGASVAAEETPAAVRSEVPVAQETERVEPGMIDVRRKDRQVELCYCYNNWV